MTGKHGNSPFGLQGTKTLLSRKQLMSLTAKKVAERTGPGVRSELEHGAYCCYTYGSSVGICAVMIANAVYPRLVAGQHLWEMIDEFTSQYPISHYQTIAQEPKNNDSLIPYPALQEHLKPNTKEQPNEKTWQDPSKGVSISKMQKDLDEIQVIIYETIESVMERGEKLDQLVAKSQELSISSKMLYSQAKKQNSCCVCM